MQLWRGPKLPPKQHKPRSVRRRSVWRLRVKFEDLEIVFERFLVWKV